MVFKITAIEGRRSLLEYWLLSLVFYESFLPDGPDLGSCLAAARTGLSAYWFDLRWYRHDLRICPSPSISSSLLCQNLREPTENMGVQGFSMNKLLDKRLFTFFYLQNKTANFEK